MSASGNARDDEAVGVSGEQAPAPADATVQAAAPVYYWETDGTAPLPPVSTRVVQTIEWVFGRAIATAEFIGEIFANIFELNNPRYEWAVEAERNRIADFEEAERIREQKERWALIERMNSQAGRSHSTAGGASAPSLPASEVTPSAGSHSNGQQRVTGTTGAELAQEKESTQLPVHAVTESPDSMPAP